MNMEIETTKQVDVEVDVGVPESGIEPEIEPDIEPGMLTEIEPEIEPGLHFETFQGSVAVETTEEIEIQPSTNIQHLSLRRSTHGLPSEVRH